MFPANLIYSRHLRMYVIGGAILLVIAISGLTHKWAGRENKYHSQRWITPHSSKERAIATELRTQQIPKQIRANNAPAKVNEWEAPSTEPFQMPHEEVLKLDFDAFDKIYEEKMRNHSSPAYRAAEDFYTMCLLERNQRNERHLTPAQRRKIRHLRSALRNWTDAYTTLAVVMIGDGTFWCGTSHTCALRREQMLFDIRKALIGSNDDVSAGQTALQKEWKVLQRQIGTSSPDKVNRWGTGDSERNRREFPAALQDMKQQTHSLKKAIDALPASVIPAVATGLQSLREEVGFDATDES